MDERHVALNGAKSAYLSQFHERCGYVNFSSVGPISDKVRQTGATLDAQFATSGPDTVDELMGVSGDVCAKIAPLVGRDADEVVMQPNTSEGLYQVAFGLSPIGGRVPVVLVGREEFPANFYPWKRAESAGLVEVRSFDGPASADRIAELIDGVDVVALSAVDYRTGYKADLDDIRTVIGHRLMVVDAIQAFGAIDCPWDRADVLLVGGQKWLRAGWGTGFMAVSGRADAALARSLLSGWSGACRSHEYDGTVHEPMRGAAKFSMTKLSPMAAGRLSTAIDLFESVGVGWISDRIASFAGRLDEDVRRLHGRLLRPWGGAALVECAPSRIQGERSSRHRRNSARCRHHLLCTPINHSHQSACDDHG